MSKNIWHHLYNMPIVFSTACCTELNLRLILSSDKILSEFEFDRNHSVLMKNLLLPCLVVCMKESQTILICWVYICTFSPKVTAAVGGSKSWWIWFFGFIFLSLSWQPIKLILLVGWKLIGGYFFIKIVIKVIDRWNNEKTSGPSKPEQKGIQYESEQ